MIPAQGENRVLVDELGLYIEVDAQEPATRSPQQPPRIMPSLSVPPPLEPAQQSSVPSSSVSLPLTRAPRDRRASTAAAPSTTARRTAPTAISAAARDGDGVLMVEATAVETPSTAAWFVSLLTGNSIQKMLNQKSPRMRLPRTKQWRAGARLPTSCIFWVLAPSECICRFMYSPSQFFRVII
jgi:mRNA-degrading endonuclease toxin of MazEF toxin-antitoxin module